MRLTVLLACWPTCSLPWGVAAAALAGRRCWSSWLAALVKLPLLGGVLAAGEVLLAKLRLFRVPELLAGSFVLALLAVTASFFLA